MLLLAPHPIAAITAGVENLLTPSPREVYAWFAPGAHTIFVDLGEERSVDTVFLGFNSSTVGAIWSWGTCADMAGGSYVERDSELIRSPGDVGPNWHGFSFSPAPIVSRYLRVAIVNNAVPPVAGVLMIGKAIVQPHEFGGGRAPIDTGAKEALPDGGFGLGDGVVKSALRWRFIGLSDDQADAIYNLALDRGERRPILAVDSRTANPADAVGRNDRIHYGLFDRLEAFERRNPADTVWAMSMTEWA